MQVLFNRTSGLWHCKHLVASDGEHFSHLGSHPIHLLLSVVYPEGHYERHLVPRRNPVRQDWHVSTVVTHVPHGTLH
jgi:hypothetical protein